MWITLVFLSLPCWAFDIEIANHFYKNCAINPKAPKSNNCLEFTKGKITLYNYCTHFMKEHKSKESTEYCKCKADQVGLEKDLKCNLKIK